MTQLTISLKEIDTKSPYFYPTRSIEIRTREHRILTPTRASTSYEYNQKTLIPDVTPIDNPISIAVKKMNVERINDFLQLNGSYKNLHKKILTDDDVLKYSSLRAHVIQPSINDYYRKDKKSGKSKKITSGVNYLLNDKPLREKFLRFVLKTQTDAGLNIVSIPYLKQPLSEYKTMAQTVTERLRNQNHEPLFVIDLGYPKRGAFEELINYLVNDLKIKLIAIPHKSFTSAAVSYDAISQLAEKDVAFCGFDVLRSDNYHFDISKMHCSPFIGTDVYSIRVPQFVPDPDEPKEERTKDSVKFFNKSNLLIESSKKRVDEANVLLEEMGEPNHKKIKEILEEYDKKDNNPEYIEQLNAVSKIHELKSSTKEFDILQSRIKTNESTDYVKDHDFLIRTLDAMKNKKS